MALISCPECGDKVSNTAPTCPHCGYVMQQRNSPVVDASDSANESSSANIVKYSDVGEFKSRLPLRILYIAFGVLLILFGLFFFPFIFIGFLCLGLSFLCSDGADCICPYCGAKGSYSKKSLNYRCIACKKTSVYVEETHQLKTVR